VTTCATRFVVATLGLWLMSGSSSLSAQASGTDAWSRVPAVPSTCYWTDGANEKLTKAKEAVNTEIGRQQEINTGIQQRVNQVDPMVKQQRMQSFLMKNPQQAQQVIMAWNASGSDIQGTMGGQDYRKDAEFKELVDQFKAAIDVALAPTQASIAKLWDTKSKQAEGGRYLPDPADQAKYKSLVGQLNTEYEKVCGAWFGSTGKFTGWFRNHKAYLSTEVIPKEEKLDKSREEMNTLMLDAKPEGYRSTAAMEEVLDYVTKLETAYYARWNNKLEPQTVMP